MTLHHKEGAECPLCQQKLLSAHESLREWFFEVKNAFLDVHISCAWRGKEDQEAAFHLGLSNAKYGHSKHNHTLNGEPYSLALDLFQLRNGVAAYRPRYFAAINDFNARNGYPIRWGGSFRSIRDCVHFELKPGEVMWK